MMPDSETSPPDANPPDAASLVRGAAVRLGGMDARREAERLLEHVLGVDRAWLFAHPDAAVAPETVARFHALLARRLSGEPLAYVLGRAGFWTLELAVGPATLIPRADTERLVEAALERIAFDGPARLADLGTGSGAIALALALERPQAQVLATDASAAALDMARANAARLSIPNVRFAQGDWCEALDDAPFDLIASNPPYIAEGDPHLLRGDLPFEPARALSSGVDGLDAIRRIVGEAPAHLRPGGWLLIEHGCDQGSKVRALFLSAGLVQVDTLRDLEGRERVTLGTRAPG